MHDLTVSDNNRFGIRPFPRVALYPTSWNGEMTFEQISEDIRPRAAKMLLRQYRVWAQDLDDCLQNGLMYVWEQLAADRDFLAKKSRFEAALIVCYRSKSTSIRKQNLRYEYMEDFWAKNDFKHPEEMRIGGLERFKIAGEHWATWATLTDIRIDIERAVLTVYEQVKDDPAGLLERHPEHDIKHAAIRGLIEGKSSRQAATAFGHNVNTLQSHRRRANKELAQVYGCTA